MSLEFIQTKIKWVKRVLKKSVQHLHDIKRSYMG